MSSKNAESSPQEKPTKSVPLRRSLRLSSSSPTPFRVVTRSSISEALIDSSKLIKKGNVSFTELTSRKEKAPVQKKITQKLGGSKMSPDLEKKIITADEDFMENSDRNTRKVTNDKYTSLEQIPENNEDSEITKPVTRSQTNFTVENVNSEKENILNVTEKNNDPPAILLKPVKEVCENIMLSLNDNEVSVADADDNNENLHVNKTEGDQCTLEESTKCNKENICPENELNQKKSCVEELDYELKIDDQSSPKSESDSFSISSDAAVTDIENKTALKSIDCSFNNENKSSEKDLNSVKSQTGCHTFSNNSNDPEVDELVNKSSEISNEEVETHNTSQPENPGEKIDNSKEHIDKKILNQSEQNYELSSSESHSSISSIVIVSGIEKLLEKHDFSCSEDEEEHPFIETMAEEGEEDTPSEGSNDIIEVGEEINTTESEFSSDDSYDQNSFIDDEEQCTLLSGDEYDLSLNSPKKKSRIIQLSSGSDDEVIRINRVKKEKPIKRKKSRIIKISDSSEDEGDVNDENHLQEVGNFVSADSEENKVADENETEEKVSANAKDASAESEENNKNFKDIERVTTIETSPQKCEEIHSDKNIEKPTAFEDYIESTNSGSEGKVVDSTADKNKETTFETSPQKCETIHSHPNIEKSSASEDDFECDQKNLKSTCSGPGDNIDNDNTTDERKETTIINTDNNKKQQIITETNENSHICKSTADVKDVDFDKETSIGIKHSTPISKVKGDITLDNKQEMAVDTKPSKNNDGNIYDISSPTASRQNLKKKVVIIENIRVQDIKNKRLSDHINEVIDSMTAKIKNASEVSINLSVDFTNESSHFDQICSERNVKESVKSFENQKNVKQGENTTAKFHDDNKVYDNRSLQEDNCIKKRKRNKKRKTSFNLSLENDVEAIKKMKKIEKNISIDNKEKRKKPASQCLSNYCINAEYDNSDIKVLPTVSKQIKEDTKFAEEEQKNHVFKKRRRNRRKHAKNEPPSDINVKEEDEPSPLRKKMKTAAKTGRVKSKLNSAGVIEEAVLNNRNNKVFLVTTDLIENNEWDLKNTIIKPSYPTPIKKMENKTITCSTSEGTKKFHSKDFKNLTLFDPSRVRRVDTKCMLKKKVSSF